MYTMGAIIVHQGGNFCTPKEAKKTRAKTPKNLDFTGFFRENHHPQKNLIGTVSNVSTVFAPPARLTRRPCNCIIKAKGETAYKKRIASTASVATHGDRLGLTLL